MVPVLKYWLAGMAVLAFVSAAGWITHVIVCIQNKEFLFLIAGAICFPLAIIHGWGVWLGVW